MKKVAFLAISLLLISCGHMNSDVSVPAIDSNYPTAEIHCDGKVFNGLAVCSNADSIQVQGYYEGSIRIDSDRCDIHETPGYSNNGAVDIKIPNPIQSCIIEVVVSVVYPRDTTTVKRSLKGIIYYKKPTDNVTFKTSKIPTKTVDVYNYYSEKLTGNNAKVYWRGCQVSVDETVTPFAGKIRMALANDVNLFEAKIAKDNPCVMEVGIVDAAVKLRVVWLSVFYKSNFSPLAIPVVKFNKKMEVYADQSVAVIGFKDQYHVGDKTKFVKADGILRLLTTSGRTVIGIVKGEDITWMQ